jgi:hypothetical protein
MPRKHFLDIYAHSNRSGAGTIASSPITTREGRKGLRGAATAESRAIRPDASWLNGIGLHGAWGSSDSEELLLAERGSLQTKKPQVRRSGARSRSLAFAPAEHQEKAVVSS